MSQTKAQLLDNIKDNVQLDARNSLRFADTDSSHYVAFKAPATVSSNVTWTLPAADGSANYVLATDGSGNLSWIADPAGQWVTSGSNIYFTGGNVGIGDSSPSNPLSVTGASAFNGDVTFTGASYNVTWDKSADDLIFNDNAKAAFGTSSDLSIYHDGSHSYIADTGTGRLHINTSELRVNNAADNEILISATENGAVELYHDNTKRFETTSAGVKASGAYLADDSTNSGTANSLSLGSSQDLKLYFDASNAYCDFTDSAFYFRHNTNIKFYVQSGGAQFVGSLYGDDNNKIELGNSQDLQIFHSGSHSYIKDNGTGELIIQGSGVNIYDGNNKSLFYGVTDGYAALYYNNAKVFETLEYGARIKRPSGGATVLEVVGCEGNNAELQLRADDGDDEHDLVKLVASDSSGLYIQTRDASAWKTNARFINGSAVELYHDNTKRFETDPDGVQVTGTIQAHKNISDSDYTSHAYHVFQQDANDIALAIFEHSGDSTPYGPIIDFSDASPDGNTRYFLDCIDSTARRMVIFSDGDVWTSDSGTLSSDETLKENIVDATPKLEDLKKLKVRNFNWKSSFHPEKSKQKQLGFIAQEVEEVFPSLVSEHDISPALPGDGHVPVMKKAIKQAWDPIIIKAMQELIAKIETLETKVAALESA